MDSKATAVELAGRLRDAAKSGDPAAATTVQMVKHLYEATKDSLVTAAGDDMLRLQGEARAYKKLHTDLTNTPHRITPE